MAVPLHHGCPSTIEIAPAAPHGLAAGADAAHLAHDLRTRTLDPLGDQAAEAEEPQQFLATAGAGPRKPGQLFRRERDIPGQRLQLVCIEMSEFLGCLPPGSQRVMWSSDPWDTSMPSVEGWRERRPMRSLLWLLVA